MNDFMKGFITGIVVTSIGFILYNKYKENNEIIDGILQEDKLFSSPSYAASFVLGRSINGKELWKTKEGLSLNDLETKEME